MGKSLFNKWYWENWTATCKRIKRDHFLTPHTKINSMWIKGISVRPETIKLLKENIGSNILDINLSNIFLHTSTEAREIKTKIKLLGLHQNKLLHSKEKHQQNSKATY